MIPGGGFWTPLLRYERGLGEVMRGDDGKGGRTMRLTRLNRVMVGRELHMVELKQEVNVLCAEAGQPSRSSQNSEMAEP